MSKGRYWSAIGYPESLPDDFVQRLKSTNLEIVISPLHNKDVDELTGELKKAHYHILIIYPNTTTLKAVQNLCSDIGLATYIEPTRNITNAIKYMTHDSFKGKWKMHYNINEIQWLNCVKDDYLKINFKQIIEYIRQKDIKQFSSLVNKLLEDDENDLLEYVSNHTYYVNTYLCSLKIDIDKDIEQTYSMLRGLAEEIDQHGKITLHKKDYQKLLDVFEQLDIFNS